MRVCTKCGIPKPLEEYHRTRKTKIGRVSECKACRKGQSTRWFQANLEQGLQTNAAWKARNKEKVAEVNIKQRLRRFGLTVDDYRSMLDEQESRCAICGVLGFAYREGPKGMVLGVDHCHTTGKVRGLLCGQCNVGIGSFKDDPKIMRAAVHYLKRTA